MGICKQMAQVFLVHHLLLDYPHNKLTPFVDINGRAYGVEPEQTGLSGLIPIKNQGMKTKIVGRYSGKR